MNKAEPGEAAAPAPRARFAGVAELAGIERVERIRRRWPAIFGAVLSVLMVIGLAWELFDGGAAGLARILPDNPLFYFTFLCAYMAAPTFDWLIYRRLWGLTFGGLGALLRKRIANDVVLGYSGDVYFYVWARERMKMVASPFGAVKDVTILSAIAANGITLAMIAVALPLTAGLLTAIQFRTLIWSIVALVAISLPFLVLSSRVFSLRRAQLWWIFAMHCARILLGSAFLALAWHYAMVEVSIGMWLLLAAARLLVTRLPLLPNKDLLFATFAIMLIGRGEALSELMALTAGLTLIAHIALLGGFGIHALTRKSD